MSEYTPTTEEVRADYCLLADVSRPRQLQFDRWLAEVKAQAWEEGNFAEDIGPDMRASNPYRHLTDNPYRQGEEQ